jgi:hypothetical protein
VNVHGVAKPNTAKHPYVVANELVCSRLASILLLPIPPGFLVSLEGASHFASLDFNLSGASLPPADPVVLAAAFPKLCWGILLFDMWVLNGDRHRKNLAFDTTADKVQIFDHSHALLARGNLPPFVGQHALTPNCCLGPEVTTLDGLAEWHGHIMDIPDRFIRTVVSDVAGPEFNVTAAQASECADFLLARRPTLIDIAKAHAATRFLKVPKAAWNEV